MRLIIPTLFLLIALPLQAHALAVNSSVVLQRSYKESLDAQALNLDIDISKEDIQNAKSQYDTLLNGEIFYLNDKSERTTTVFGTETTATEYNLGVAQMFPTGTLFSIDFLNTKQTSDSIFALDSSLFDSRFVFSLSQPLLKNYFGYTTRKNVELAKKNSIATEATVDASLMDLAYKNLQVYWNWFRQLKLKTISQNALEASKRLYRTNNQKKNIGLIEESDLYAFAADVDLKESDLHFVQSNLALAEKDLRIAINMPYDQLDLENQSMEGRVFPSIEEMTNEALVSHPHYIRIRKTLDAQNVLLAMQKNSRLPQVDLNASLSLNGIDPSYGPAFSDIADGNPIWTAGINVTFPIQNRNAKAEYKKSKLEKAKLLFALKDIELRIISRMREGLQKYNESLKRMKVVEIAVKHQKLKWEGEIKKYEQGRSDPDIVIRYQNDYLDTQKLLVDAQVRYQLDMLDLLYFWGKLK